MNVQQQGVLSLIRSAILHQPETLPDAFSLSKAVHLIEKLQITSIALEGALLCGISPERPEMQALVEKSCALYTLSSRQTAEIKALCAEFDENQVDYILLKGTTLKELYPEPHMREMADADILIRIGQYEKIKPILCKLDFKKGIESNHELHWEKPTLHLELHKRLIPSNNKLYSKYFQNVWSRAIRVSDAKSQYVLPREDELIFDIVHFAKHYRDGGIGPKHLIDLYLLMGSDPTLNFEYVLSELKQISLDAFFKNLCDTMKVWFGTAEHTPVTETITDVILSSGAFGDQKMQYIASAARCADTSGSTKRGRRKRIRYLFFPSFDSMCSLYPVLRKVPVLLPAIWVYRWVHALLFKSKTVKKRYEEARSVTPQVIESYQKKLAFVGLHFDGNEQ